MREMLRKSDAWALLSATFDPVHSKAAWVCLGIALLALWAEVKEQKRIERHRSFVNEHLRRRLHE